MQRFGYKLMSEEHSATALVDNAQRAEAAGFDHLILLGIGPDQDAFIKFWEKELSPRLH